MALEKADLTTISKFVRDTVERMPPRAVKAMGVGRVLGSPQADTPPSNDVSDRLATTSFVKTAVGLYVPVTSVFGRTGAVVAQSGDYNASQVTHALDLSNGGTQVLTGTLNAGNLEIGGLQLPGTELGYDQITGTVSVTATSAATATSIIAGTAHSFDGSPVLLEFYAPGVSSPSVAGDSTWVLLFEGSTQIAQIAQVQTPSAASMGVTVKAGIRFTPSAGSHTYSIKAWATVTTGTPRVFAGSGSGGAAAPAYMRFTKV